MPRRRSWNERGSASIEFLIGGLVMLVPLAYLMIAVGEVQHESMAAQAIAREAANAYARTGEAGEASARAAEAIADVAAEYGIDPASLAVDVGCDGGGACPRAGALVRVSVATSVALPFLPQSFGLGAYTSVPVDATAVQRVSRYWTGS
ncbi:MAG: TadE family protein [Microbacterium sp.]